MGGGVGGDYLYGDGGDSGGKKFIDPTLGALGIEAMKLKEASKSEKEMEDLAKMAHDRKAEAQRKKDQKMAEAAAALEAKRKELVGKRAEMAAAAESGRAAAVAALASLDEAALADAKAANGVAQQEEFMVLEAIFGEEALTKEGEVGEGELPAAFVLNIEGATAAGKACQVKLRIELVPEYPSHMPPSVSIEEGVGDDDLASVTNTLHARFFTQRQEAGDDCELSECVVIHQWSEWLRDEWMANL